MDTFQLDHIDRTIMQVLDRNPRASVVTIAQESGLARRTVHTHLEKLEARGALRPTSARVETASLGYPIQAHVAVELDQRHINETVAALSRIPQVVEVQAPAGETDLLVRVVARDSTDLYSVSEDIRLCPGVMRTRTSMYLRTLIPYRTHQLLHRNNPTGGAAAAK